ncbi:MAG TPA: four-helix bundle copper-binding protein [Kofleriaceae bacterium]
MQRTVERMLRTHPEPSFAPPDPLSACVHACVECAQACTACADACIAEHDRELARCIRINLDCADLCTAASRVLSRQLAPDLGVVSMALQLCAAVCDACAYECRRHAESHAHCDVCAAACRRCTDACRDLLATTVTTHRSQGSHPTGSQAGM